MSFQVLPSPEIWHRDDFALLCEWRKLYRAVEVGVDRGAFAECFLSRCYNCDVYIGVDPYLPDDVMGWDREADYASAVTRLGRFPNKAKLIRADSFSAVELLQKSAGKIYSDPWDFVYLDACHTKEAVKEDLSLWYPSVSEHGIIAGHDWSTPSGEHSGVQEAVVEFAKIIGQAVYYTPDDPASWYIYKSGMPDANWVRVDDTEREHRS